MEVWCPRYAYWDYVENNEAFFKMENVSADKDTFGHHLFRRFETPWNIPNIQSQEEEKYFSGKKHHYGYKVEISI